MCNRWIFLSSLFVVLLSQYTASAQSVMRVRLWSSYISDELTSLATTWIMKHFTLMKLQSTHAIGYECNSNSSCNIRFTNVSLSSLGDLRLSVYTGKEVLYVKVILTDFKVTGCYCLTRNIVKTKQKFVTNAKRVMLALELKAHSTTPTLLLSSCDSFLTPSSKNASFAENMFYPYFRDMLCSDFVQNYMLRKLNSMLSEEHTIPIDGRYMHEMKETLGFDRGTQLFFVFRFSGGNFTYDYADIDVSGRFISEPGSSNFECSTTPPPINFPGDMDINRSTQISLFVSDGLWECLTNEIARHKLLTTLTFVNGTALDYFLDIQRCATETGCLGDALPDVAAQYKLTPHLRVQWIPYSTNKIRVKTLPGYIEMITPILVSVPAEDPSLNKTLVSFIVDVTLRLREVRLQERKARLLVHSAHVHFRNPPEAPTDVSVQLRSYFFQRQKYFPGLLRRYVEHYARLPYLLAGSITPYPAVLRFNHSNIVFLDGLSVISLSLNKSLALNYSVPTMSNVVPFRRARPGYAAVHDQYVENYEFYQSLRELYGIVY